MYSSGIMDTQDSEAGRNPLWESQSMMEPQGGAANPLYGSQSDILASRDSMGAGGHCSTVQICTAQREAAAAPLQCKGGRAPLA